MTEFIEKLIERLEQKSEKMYEETRRYSFPVEKMAFYDGKDEGYSDSARIVKELAEEYNDGWIPVEERLPEECGTYIIWWTDLSKQEYYEMAEYDPEEGWLEELPQAANGCYEVIAWRELPAPYQPKGE